MPRKPISFELDFTIKDIFPRFTVKQFDDVSFNIKPKNQGLDYDTTGMTGKIFIGVNNDMFMQTKNITVSNNNVNILLDRNMLQKNGRAYAEVELTDSNGTITSSSFIFNIDAKIGEGAKIPGEYEGFVEKYERLISEFKSQINSTINNCNKSVDNKLNVVDSLINVKISDFEERFNMLTVSQQQDAEVIDARDGETSLKARLDRDLYKDGISLSDRIEAIEGLKDSQNMKYETDKGYLVCKETKNGVIDDLKIEGKTLVNLVKISNVTLQQTNGTNVNSDHTLIINGKAHTDYTICINVEKMPTSGFLNCGVRDISNNHIKDIFIDGEIKQGLNVKSFTSSLEFKYLRLIARNPTIGEGIIKNIIILEGDHTQNPPSYFEGLMSVGQDVDEIEVSSVKGDGNLFDSDINSYVQTNIIANGGSKLELSSENLSRITLKSNVKVNPSKTYFLTPSDLYDYGVICTNDNDIVVYNSMWSNAIEFKFPQTSRKLFIYAKRKDGQNIDKQSFVCENHVFSTIKYNSYTPHQSDKKQILFYNENGELEPIQELHEWDSIEKHSDNKWYYHKRSGKVVLDGSENWNIVHLELDNTHRLGTNKLINCMKPNCTVICDKFTQQTDDQQYNNDIEGISTNANSNLYIRISKSKLSTQDVEGFKQWLQTNNVTVVYQLAQEEVYELAPLHLDSYANETLILCNSGAISPKMEFSITSHINELVKAYGERVNLLEEKVYQYMVTQNRMQLASTYSTDSVTFKVDYFSLCGDEENYNEDLYNLILNNILVGKDNYDYDKMFTMILDYASWNQISWEQFDILVGLMDIQHNPPIEEIPTEDEVIEETPNEIM